MDTLSQHYHRMVGLNEDWTVSDVELDTGSRTLTLVLEFVGSTVTCPECGAGCSKKDHAASRSWRHLDAMQFQTVLTARVPRSTCNDCGIDFLLAGASAMHSAFAQRNASPIETIRNDDKTAGTVALKLLFKATPQKGTITVFGPGWLST